MIIYDLKCQNEHKFEGWFKDIQTFEIQKTQKLITCPVCQSFEVNIVVSSVSVLGKESKISQQRSPQEISPEKALRFVKEFIQKNFEDAGDRFAEVALKIYHGEEESRNIKGTTTDQEEEMLREEGVPFIKIPLPKYDG